ncbi:MAG: hypothetical protein RBT36_00195 [Desulfobulbus sp.]|nr:hypothetical protein [Desulfobulbus sp.]
MLQISLPFRGWSEHRRELLLLGVFNLLFALLLGLLVLAFMLLFFQGLEAPPSAAATGLALLAGVRRLAPLLMLALASPAIAAFTLTSHIGYSDLST